MDIVAGLLELIALFQLGEYERAGFLFNVAACGIWVYVSLNKKIYGLLLVAVPAIILNIVNYIKWSGL